MALTIGETEWVKKEKQKSDLLAQINSINETAYNEIHSKQNEIQVLENQRIADVKVIQDQIDAL